MTMPIPQYFARLPVAFLPPTSVQPVSGTPPAARSDASPDARHATTSINQDGIMAFGSPDGNELFRFAPAFRLTAAVGISGHGAVQRKHSLSGASLAPRHSANYHMTEAQTRRLFAPRPYRSPMAFEQKPSMIFVNSVPLANSGRTAPRRSEF
jgi:hypothetical protein